MDKNRKKHAIITDFLLILTLGAMLALIGIGLRMLFGRNASSDMGNTGTEVYVIRVRGIEDGAEEHLHIGDRLIDRKNRQILGTVTDIRTQPGTEEIYNEIKGTLEMARIPGAKDAEITVEYENGLPNGIAVGKSVSFRTYDFWGAGDVTRIGE